MFSGGDTCNLSKSCPSQFPGLLDDFCDVFLKMSEAGTG